MGQGVRVTFTLYADRTAFTGPASPLEEIRFRHDMSAYGVHELPVTW